MVLAFVLVLGGVPALGWLAHVMWPERRLLGPDPGHTVAAYWLGALVTLGAIALVR